MSKFGATISSGPKLDRSLRLVFAYEGATWKTILSEIQVNDFQDTFDLICILKRGVLSKNGLILGMGDQIEFQSFEGKAVALGFLYMYLVMYGSTFLGRSLKLNPYFEPINKWETDPKINKKK